MTGRFSRAAVFRVCLRFVLAGALGRRNASTPSFTFAIRASTPIAPPSISSDLASLSLVNPRKS